jgi:SET domain-containing protein
MEKSSEWKADQDQRRAEIEQYQGLLEKLNVSDSLVQQESQNPVDQMQMPFGSYKIAVHESPIQGKGVFATSYIEAGELIGPVKLNGYRTPIGRYMNHSDEPNAKVEIFGSDLYLISLQPIQGYKGGQLGDEILTNYEHNLKKSQEAICQE